MFPFKFKKRYFFSTIFFCFSHLLSQSEIALAQLRLGRGIQPGLEGHLLEYQIQKQPLAKMRGISGCSVGFGVGCNKTASLLQQIVTESSGKSYQDVLLEAAGGQDNYLRFTRYYSQNVDISDLPLNSFWINGGDYVLDSHQYSGLENLDRIPQGNFRQVVSQFTYAPIASRSQNFNLQQGLIGLKTAYGRALLEEAKKIPNIEQKIAASGLNEAQTKFHLQQFLNSIEAIERGNPQQINQSLYQLLSNPYTSDPGVLNRPSLGISSNLDQKIGVGLEQDEYIASVITPSLMTPDVNDTFIFSSADVVASAEGISSSGSSTPLYVAAGVGGLTLLVLLLTNLEVDSSPNETVAVVDDNENNQPGGEENPGVNPIPIAEKPPEIEIPTPPGSEVTVIPEPTSRVQFLFLAMLPLIIQQKRKYRHQDKNNEIITL